MNVVIVIGSLHGGGAERQMQYLVDFLAGRGDLITICLLNDGNESSSVGSVRIVALREKTRSWVKALRVFRTTVKGADVIYSYTDVANAFASLGSLRTGTPHVWGLRSTGVAPGVIAQGSFKLARLLSSKAVVAIGNSEAVCQFYSGAGFRPKAWRVIPNGVDATRFKPRLQAEVASRQIVVGMIARPQNYKRFDIFFDLVARLQKRFPNVAWQIAGVGTDDPNSIIPGLLARYGVSDQVEVLGEIQDVPRLMSTFDISICCSDFEGSANVILEAISCGVPVVSFNVGDAALLLSDCGIVVEPATIDALAHAVERLLSDGNLRRELSVRGRQHALDNFSVEKMAKQTRDVLVEVVTQRSGNSH